MADSNGFRILGNDLPIGPETPAAAILGAPALTASVEGAHKQVVDAAQHPSKRQNTIDIEKLTTAPLLRHYQQQEIVFRQRDELLQQQQRVIEQQQRQLDELTGKTTNFAIENLSTRVNEVVGAPATVQYNTIESNSSPDDPNYYFYPYNYNYDFPAGFAYDGGVVEVVEVVPEVIGVRGSESEVRPILCSHF